MPFQFKIEHIALQPHSPDRARNLLEDLGLGGWIGDTMTVFGDVWANRSQVAKTHLEFNYEADCDRTNPDGSRRPIELEIMSGCEGPNWMDGHFTSGSFISHFGMQVTNDQLFDVHNIMSEHCIEVAQDVVTIQHENSHIKDERRYHKVIFNTRPVLGVDLEFNVLIPIGG